MGKILITPKINPDLDGVACAYAYSKLLNKIYSGNEYTAGIYGQAQNEALFLLDKFQINDVLSLNPVDISFDEFIIVDASDTKGMPAVIRPQDVIEIVDHRETNKAREIFHRAKLDIELVGAAATLIFEKFQEMKQDIDFDSALLLYGAIFSNTLNLKNNVDNRDLTAVTTLEEILRIRISEPKDIVDEMFQCKTKYIEENLEECIRSDFKHFDDGLGVAQLEGFDMFKIITEHYSYIKGILDSVRNEFKLDKVFLTAADIRNGYNIFLAINNETAELLTDKMNIEFDVKGIAKSDRLYLRKQILPMFV